MSQRNQNHRIQCPKCGALLGVQQGSEIPRRPPPPSARKNPGRVEGGTLPTGTIALIVGLAVYILLMSLALQYCTTA